MAVLKAACFLLLFAGRGDAQIYYCALTDVVTITVDGSFAPFPLKDSVLKTQLVVDTDSGKVFHPFFGNSQYDFLTILDHGSEISAFKVVANSKESSRLEDGVAGFRNAAFFQLFTYEEGTKKPFMAIDANGMAIGVCE
ncbi:MAG: hypothetical protein ABIV25_02315 [Paracoccaceae bacterium]